MTPALDLPLLHSAPRATRAALSLLAVLGAWELLAQALAGAFLLAGPLDVSRYLIAHAGLLVRALSVTLQEAVMGYLWGNLAGVALAALVLLLPRLETMLQSLALIVFCLPLVATGPILRVLYGPGIGPQVTLAALAVYYTTFVPMVVGLRATPSSWCDLVASYGRGRWCELLNIRAMASVPYLVIGLQVAAPAAFLGAMVGEFTGAERGMGVLAIQAMRSLDVEATWALATVASAVSIAAYLGVGALGNALWPDRPTLILSAGTGRSARRGALVWPLVSLAAALLLWWGVFELFDLNRFFAKRPGDVWAYLVTAPQAGEHRAVLWAAMGETLLFAGPGYLAGLLAGAGLAAVFVVLPGLARVVLPLAIALRSIPIGHHRAADRSGTGARGGGDHHHCRGDDFLSDSDRLPAGAAPDAGAGAGCVCHLCHHTGAHADAGPGARDAAGVFRLGPYGRSCRHPCRHRGRVAVHWHRHWQSDGAHHFDLGL